MWEVMAKQRYERFCRCLQNLSVSTTLHTPADILRKMIRPNSENFHKCPPIGKEVSGILWHIRELLSTTVGSCQKQQSLPSSKILCWIGQMSWSSKMWENPLAGLKMDWWGLQGISEGMADFPQPPQYSVSTWIPRSSITSPLILKPSGHRKSRNNT